jgi:hypothetical protein
MGVNWDLAHRPLDGAESTPATVEASDSWAAVEQLRGAITADHLVLYVRPALSDQVAGCRTLPVIETMF